MQQKVIASSNMVNYSDKKLSKIAAIAIKEGNKLAVANYLEVSVSKLYSMRKLSPKLDKAIKEGFASYIPSNLVSDDYEFTTEELEKITDAVRDSNVETASKKYGVNASCFFKLRKTNSALDAAINKGQFLRKNKGQYPETLEKLKNLTLEELEEVTKITLEGGARAVGEYFKVSTHTFRRCRAELPKLDAAVIKALDRRPKGQAIVQQKLTAAAKDSKKIKSRKPYKKKEKVKLPPKELINAAMLDIFDNSEIALASFRQIVAEKKLRDTQIRLRNKDEFENMIGI